MSLLYTMPSAPLEATKNPVPSRAPSPQVPSIKAVPTVGAIANVEALPGATRSWMMQADDGHLYAVKFTSNPFGARVLVNEYVAGRLAQMLRLATPPIALIHVPEGLGRPAGLHFGSRIQVGRGGLSAHDWLPAAVWGLVQNPEDIIGAFVFDAWTGNVDERQLIFVRKTGPRPFKLFCLDHGHCFGGTCWRLLGLPILFPRRLQFAFESVTGWRDLEPWLTRIEEMEPRRIDLAAKGIPEEWLAGAGRTAFARLKGELASRRLTIRSQIAQLLARGGHPFACWRYRSSLYVVPAHRALAKTA